MSLGLDILSHKLQAMLDNRREEGRLIEPLAAAPLDAMIDFGSNDSLSLSSSGALSTALLHELQKNPGFTIGSTSSRILDGTRRYLEDIERGLARFHRAESAMFYDSGYNANVAVWSPVPQPGDFVVYDEYVHASIHDGLRQGRAITVPFKHNDCESLRNCLKDIQAEHPSVSEGKHVVFISLESFYSVDGDKAPIREIVDVVRDVLPRGNYVLAIDEAHSNGVVGPNGSGFICHYGLEGDFGIRTYTCGKGLGSAGAVLLVNETIKAALLNYARNVIFTTAPSFLTVSAVKAGYNLVASEEGEKRRCRLQKNLRYFYQTLTASVEWEQGKKQGIFSLPTEETWRSEPFLAPIAAIIVQPGKAKELARRINQANYRVNPLTYPIVPKDKNRIRIVIHTDNTESQMEGIICLLREWARRQMRLASKGARNCAI